jgi:rRNA maturation protein Rpf1
MVRYRFHVIIKESYCVASLFTSLINLWFRLANIYKYKGFGTRLGHRVGRFLGSIFPHNAQFQGRQVVTFHNQRDYIFVRHHRYIFEEGKQLPQQQQPKIDSTTTQDEKEGTQANPKKQKNPTRARLQELGPRFTLKLKWIQEVRSIERLFFL